MLILSNKLLVLLAGDTMKSSAFTAKELVNDTLESFPKWFQSPEIAEHTLRSTVSSLVRQELIMQIGETTKEPAEVGQRSSRVSYLYCFTDKGRKQRLEASHQLDSVILMIDKIVATDLRANVTKMTGRKKKAA